jgi:hypothetical protein
MSTHLTSGPEALSVKGHSFNAPDPDDKDDEGR